jgi:hypothetical protein
VKLFDQCMIKSGLINLLEKFKKCTAFLPDTPYHLLNSKIIFVLQIERHFTADQSLYHVVVSFIY